MTTYLGPEGVIAKKKAYLCPPSWNHFYQNPPQIVKGKMQYLYDHEGKKYLDGFAGVSVMNCGHCNEDILRATIEQMQTLQHTSIIYLTEPMTNLAEKLSTVLPGNLSRSFFCCTGSEANETALLMARLYTGKQEFIALGHGLHGRTYMTMSTTAIPMWRTDPYLSDAVHFVPNPFEYGAHLEEAARASLKAIKKLVEKRGKEQIAALIVEPIQGNGGIITPPAFYFKELKALLEAHDILMIVDEVQTGFARTGKMFAIEHYGVVPDIMTVAKALGNGMPISAACTTDAIAMAFNKPSASTLGGNPVCAATALAVLDYIETQQLCKRAEELGTQLMEGLQRLSKQYPMLVDVRGKGLMLGVEVRDKDGNPKPEWVDFILEEMKEAGFIVGKNGLHRNVLAFQPPLVIEKQDICDLLQALEAVLSQLENKNKCERGHHEL